MTNKTDKNSNKTRAGTPSKIDERTTTDTNPETDFFGPAIYTYSRKQALADGVQVEVPPAVAKEAGFKFPVYLTDTVYAAYVDVPDGLSGQDEDGRLWDILTMLHNAIRNAPADASRIPFSLYVQNEEEKTPTRQAARRLQRKGLRRTGTCHYGNAPRGRLTLKPLPPCAEGAPFPYETKNNQDRNPIIVGLPELPRRR